MLITKQLLVAIDFHSIFFFHSIVSLVANYFAELLNSLLKINVLNIIDLSVNDPCVHIFFNFNNALVDILKNAGNQTILKNTFLKISTSRFHRKSYQFGTKYESSQAMTCCAFLGEL